MRTARWGGEDREDMKTQTMIPSQQVGGKITGIGGNERVSQSGPLQTSSQMVLQR